jgi:ribosome biogenesis GTPase
MMTGIVLCGGNNVFDVECGDSIIRRCTLKGKKLKTTREFYNPLAPGDTVEIEIDSRSVQCAQIVRVEERKNCFSRWNEKGRATQLIASNVDLVMIVTTPALPPFRPRFIDRALCQAEQAGIEAVIALNKRDIAHNDEDEDARVEERIAGWTRIGYKCLKISAKTKEGFDELSRVLKNKFTAFVGQSGVGKSSIINTLCPDSALKTGDLSQKYERGNHTTTKGVLLKITIDSAFAQNARASVIDTPGVRRFALNGITQSDLALYFRETKELVGTCAFGMSCTHTNEAGCAVLGAAQNGAFSKERYESFVRIARELKNACGKD